MTMTGALNFSLFFVCHRNRTEKPEMPQVQAAVRRGPVTERRMAHGSRVEANAVAISVGRTSGPHTSARTRHCATRSPGLVQTRAQAARLTVRGTAAGHGGGARSGRNGDVGRDARTGEVVAGGRPVVGRQSRAADRDADRRRRGPSANT